MSRTLERFEQDPLGLLVTKRIFEEVTDPQRKFYQKMNFATGLSW